MGMIAVFLNIDEERVVSAPARGRRETGRHSKAKSVLDFSSVRRIDSSALRAIEDFARHR